MRAKGRASRALRRSWYRGVDYAWALREIGRGLADPALPSRYARGDLSPALLLPGVLENWTMMRAIAERLHAAGHPVHALAALDRNTVSVPAASALGSAYLAERGLRGTILVAHSKGGLIGKHMMLADAERRIDRLIAVSTPFAGSSLARLLPHRTIRALGPGDPTIVALGGRRDVNDRITSIYPSFDPHIPAGCRLEGATNVQLESAGHFRVLGDPAVIAAVLEAAARSSPTAGSGEVSAPAAPPAEP